MYGGWLRISISNYPLFLLKKNCWLSVQNLWEQYVCLSILLDGGRDLKNALIHILFLDKCFLIIWSGIMVLLIVNHTIFTTINLLICFKNPVHLVSLILVVMDIQGLLYLNGGYCLKWMVWRGCPGWTVQHLFVNTCGYSILKSMKIYENWSGFFRILERRLSNDRFY